MQKLNYDEEARHWKWEIPEYYNIGQDCVDKHAEGVNKNKVALYWENEKGVAEKYTFLEMKNLSNKFGNVLRKLGLKKGPTIPDCVYWRCENRCSTHTFQHNVQRS